MISTAHGLKFADQKTAYHLGTLPGIKADPSESAGRAAADANSRRHDRAPRRPRAAAGDLMAQPEKRLRLTAATKNPAEPGRTSRSDSAPPRCMRGEPRQKAGNALTTPIMQTATYTFADTQELRDHFEHRIEREEYGRYGNPTQRIAEQKLAALEGADDCLLFSSGMAAVTTDALRDAVTRSPRRRHRRLLSPHAPIPEPDAAPLRHRSARRCRPATTTPSPTRSGRTPAS